MTARPWLLLIAITVSVLAVVATALAAYTTVFRRRRPRLDLADDLDLYKRELARRNAVQDVVAPRGGVVEQFATSSPAPAAPPPAAAAAGAPTAQVASGSAAPSAPATRIRTSLCFHVRPGADGRCADWFNPDGSGGCKTCIPATCGMQGNEYVCKPLGQPLGQPRGTLANIN
jgi:hypothetical protein